MLLRSIRSPLQPDFCHCHAGHSQPSIAVDVRGRCGHGTDERNLGRRDLSGLSGMVGREHSDSGWCSFPLADTCCDTRETLKSIYVHFTAYYGTSLIVFLCVPWLLFFIRQVAATVVDLHAVAPCARNSMKLKRPRRKQRARQSS